MAQESLPAELHALWTTFEMSYMKRAMAFGHSSSSQGQPRVQERLNKASGYGGLETPVQLPHTLGSASPPLHGADNQPLWSDDSRIVLGSFDSVEGFWKTYGHCVRAPDSTYVYCFRKGYVPLWESYEDGYIYSFHCLLLASPRYFEDLLLAFIGNTGAIGQYIRGVSASYGPRNKFHKKAKIQIWCNHLDDEDKKDLEKQLSKIFQLQDASVLVCKSIKDAVIAVSTPPSSALVSSAAELAAIPANPL